jgi:formamidopyrimidine-DNA glycosylase
MQANGELGVFQDSFAVYDRANAPCPACGRPVVKLVQGGRATYMCRRCQR